VEIRPSFIPLLLVAAAALAVSCSKDRRIVDGGISPDAAIDAAMTTGGEDGGSIDSGGDGEDSAASQGGEDGGNALGEDAAKALGPVAVPQGSFWMGCNQDLDGNCRDDEHPYREVELGAFELDRYEVTVAEYRACVDAGTCTAPDTGGACNWDVAGTEDNPINCVDWGQASAYCDWAGRRLPTEAEWEKAARGSDGRTYPWGEEDPDCSRAVMNDGGNGCGTGKTMAAGSVPAGASPHGAMDMAGNVWEWVADWYDRSYYEKAPAGDPPGPADGTLRVARGGSWYGGTPQDLRASRRNPLDPSFRNHDLGFRCAATP
jgi:sulfatase modifying factor 1